MIKKTLLEILTAFEYSMPFGTFSTIILMAFSDEIRNMTIWPFLGTFFLTWLGFSFIWAMLLVQIDKYIKRK